MVIATHISEELALLFRIKGIKCLRNVGKKIATSTRRESQKQSEYWKPRIENQPNFKFQGHSE